MKKNSGSALLVVLVITSLISVMMLSYWQQTSLLFDLVHERDVYHVRHQALFNFFNAAANFVKKHHEQISANVFPKKPLSFDLEQQLSLAENKLTKGLLTIYRDDATQSLRLKVQLVEDSHTTLGVQSLIIKQPTVYGEKLVISHFSYGA